MPPATKSMMYDLPLVLRLPYIAIVGVVVGGTEIYMVNNNAPDETARFVIMLGLLCLGVFLYNTFARLYGKHFGSKEIA